MRVPAVIPRYTIYVIDHSLVEAGVIFYGLVIVILLESFSAMTGARMHRPFTAITLPYTEIQPHGPALESVATKSTARLITSPASVPATGSVWPLHGMVTTEFGAPDYPFQSHHTGIDISTGQRPGRATVVAFHSGTVISVGHAYGSYGNNVIIDHGSGLTSLYGHLYSISVSSGQHVNARDPIGTEGSTGASTGPHLHFEIRQDGSPRNPRLFVSGSP